MNLAVDIRTELCCAVLEPPYVASVRAKIMIDLAMYVPVIPVKDSRDGEIIALCTNMLFSNTLVGMK